MHKLHARGSRVEGVREINICRRRDPCDIVQYTCSFRTKTRIRGRTASVNNVACPMSVFWAPWKEGELLRRASPQAGSSNEIEVEGRSQPPPVHTAAP